MSRQIDSDRVIAFSAIFISVVSLILLVYQVSEERRQNRLSVRPRLSFTETESTQDQRVTYGIVLRNKGLGPAIVESAVIRLHEEEFAVNFNDLMEAKAPGLDTIYTQRETTSIDEGTSIMPDETVTLVRFTVPQDRLAAYAELLAYHNLEEFDVEVVYSSIYEERWRVTLNGENSHPEEL